MLKSIFRVGIQKKSNFSLQKMSPFTSMTKPEPVVYFHEHGSKRIITLNRPKSLNAINLDMLRLMYPKLKEWDESKEAELVIIKSGTEKIFSAGGDVIAVINSAKETLGGKKNEMYKTMFREVYILDHLIHTLSKPYIALVDGLTVGGAHGFCVIGRFCVATERALMSLPETALGMVPDIGASHFLSRLRSNIGMYLSLTGARITGADAYHIGLVTHLIDSSNLPIVEKSLLSSNRLDDKSINELLNSFKPTQIPPLSLADHENQIDECFGADSVEEIIERLREDGSEWAKKQIKILSAMSPTSLKITYRMMKIGRTLDYAEALKMDLRITHRISLGYDFHEGVRAILLDKDKNPKWNPKKLNEVTEEQINAYFEPLPEEELKLPQRRTPSKL